MPRNRAVLVSCTPGGGHAAGGGYHSNERWCDNGAEERGLCILSLNRSLAL